MGALARPEVLIHDPGLCAEGAAALRASFPRLRLLAVGPGGEYERLLQDQPPRPSGAALRGGDPALLIVTAGTAGFWADGFRADGLRAGGEPRGLTFSQQALTAALRLAALNLDPLPGGPEVLLEAVPLCAGGGWALLPVLFAGGALVLPRRPDAARLAELVGRHRVTRALLTPALLADLLDLPARQRAALPGPLRSLLVAGGPLPAGRMAEAARCFGPIVQAAYGLPEIPAPVCLQGRERPGAGTPAGRVVPGVGVRIAGRAGRPVAAGTAGEILVDSPAAFCGYWERPDLSGWAFRDGGFHTGDQGFLDAEGLLHVLGRRSERIERGGRTLLPPDVEGPALEHPGVKEACLVERDGVLTLAVSRRANRGGGEEGVDPESLRAFLAERLESWQLPERIAILEALPRDERLQVSRRRVREAVGSPAPAHL